MKQVDDFFHDLPRLPSHLHIYQEPRHHSLLGVLGNHRVLLLFSYKAIAAWAAAYSLALDAQFSRQLKKFIPSYKGYDLDFYGITSLLGDLPQVLVTEIDRHCTLLDSILLSSYTYYSRFRDTLEDRESYAIFVVHEDAMPLYNPTAVRRSAIPSHRVSHLHYLLSRDFPDRTEEIEMRLLTAVERSSSRIDLREVYELIGDRLAEGAAAFEAFILELERASDPTSSDRKKQWDVFISHASEDKDELAKPLALLLREMGLNVWYDDFVLRVGDRLRRSIEHGLAESCFGVVLLSPNFFRKEWTQRELDGLLALEGDRPLILPVWHGLGINEIKRFSPLLADRVGISTSKGLSAVASQIFEAVRGRFP